jgi:N-acetylglutamate synthase-like GNAT family acetyltransferase
MNFQIVKHNSREYRETIALRTIILREPLGLTFSESELAAENTSYHIASYVDGRVVACLVLKPNTPNVIQMRQVAVDSSMQGSGIGRAIVAFSEQFAKENGYAEMILHARQTAVAFYLKLGYQINGDVFEEVSLPHNSMSKML